MVGVKIQEIQALGIQSYGSQIDAGLKKSKMADMYCIIPHFLAYEVLKSSIFVTIRFNHAEESKYEIMIPFE